MSKDNFATHSIHKGEEPDFSPGKSGDVVFPIHLSTTYAREKLEIPTEGYEYSRSDNPTRKALEAKLAALEEANHGLAFASGLAAEMTLIFALLSSGDEILASDDLYGGTRRLFTSFKKFGIHTRYVDSTQADNITLEDNTRMVWLETPTNPLLKLTDLAAVSERINREGIVTVVDNTFMSPYFQNPLQYGADVVVHSTTKYIGGHSDVVGGAIMANDQELYEKIKFHQNALGAVPAPFDCYLTMRGIKTLEVRMKKHQQNALAIAKYLEAHPEIEHVVYPGLPSHPQYQLAQQQMSGFGGVITFFVKGGYERSKKFLESVRVFALAESLGGVESLIEHPASMTHASVEAEDRAALGITDNLIRASVGIEEVDDLIKDLEQALE